ncbi:MAG: EFR1 family ferrodoxin [Lachnospiraceae bacterium]|nr:EFR1 family ferrodoxin [Lachnospiraceae bacterium]
MALVQIVFSPTGGTGKVADIIAEEWEGPVTCVDLSDGKTDFSKIKLEQRDAALIAVPSYGGRVPELAAKRLMKINGNKAKCVIVCVYGNRAYEDTLIEMQDIVESCGFHTIAAVSAIAEHSIIHQYAAGRPDESDAEKLRGFAKKIYRKFMDDEPSASEFEIPGNRPYRKAGGAGLVPKATKECVSCGLCAKNCPAQAISKDSLKTADSKKCISCMRCVAICPQSARKANGALVSAAALALKKACSERKEAELFY